MCIRDRCRAKRRGTRKPEPRSPGGLIPSKKGKRMPKELTTPPRVDSKKGKRMPKELTTSSDFAAHSAHDFSPTQRCRLPPRPSRNRLFLRVGAAPYQTPHSAVRLYTTRKRENECRDDGGSTERGKKPRRHYEGAQYLFGSA
eukprot:2961246-Rhodomonas_salina.1